MFLPLHDDNPLKNIQFQYVTVSFIAICVTVFLYQLSLGEGGGRVFVFRFGAIPAVVFGIKTLPVELTQAPAVLSLVTSMFLHGGFMHLLGNMLFLWVFGDNVEDALGHFRYLVFYLLCAVAGALAHGFLVPESTAPLIGASGAISGVIGAYLMLHPKVRIWVLAFGRIPLRLPAAIPLLVWFAYQIGAVALVFGVGIAKLLFVGA